MTRETEVGVAITVQTPGITTILWLGGSDKDLQEVYDS